MAKNGTKAKIAAVIVVVIIIGVFLGWMFSQTPPQDGLPTTQNDGQNEPNEPNLPDTQALPAEQVNQPPQADPLQEIIAQSRTWSPAFENWNNKQAPNFTLTDLDGTEHSLQQYRGKDVLVVFWATWCPPCRDKIPHLVALRNILPDEELAILAISNEAPQTIQRFVQNSNINYTVLLSQNNLPEPFSNVNSLPTAFFIDKNGNFKIATMGSMHLGTMKNIIEVQTNNQ